MLWIGLRSMQIDASRPSGALYRVGVDGASDRKEFGLVVANGLGWSPDGRTFYLVDTIPGLIYAYDSDPHPECFPHAASLRACLSLRGDSTALPSTRRAVFGARSGMGGASADGTRMGRQTSRLICQSRDPAALPSVGKIFA